MKTKPIPGKDYWPDQSEWSEADIPEETPSLVTQAIWFIAIFAGLEVTWLVLRENSIGHFFRHELTVIPTTWLINLCTPEVNASALGNQILAKGGGLVVKLGCEGMEAKFILIAAMLSAPLSWSAKCKGLFWGVLFIYIFNQLRLLILFYTYRTDKDLFHLLHGTIAPLALIVLAALFFHWWLNRTVNQNT